jgi:hypothetical protein
MNSTSLQVVGASEADSPVAPRGCVYTHSVHERIEDVDLAEWDRAGGGSTLFMDPRFIAATEHALRGNARFWHIVFRDRVAPVACATLCLYEVDLAVLASARVKSAFGLIRHLAPRFGRVKVLFCGLPVSLGQNSVAFARGCDAAEILRSLDSMMLEIAARERLSFRVFKEFDPGECRTLDLLLTLGWSRAESPCMHVLEPAFADFDAYCAALTAHYRQDINRSRRKFSGAGFRYVRLRGHAVEAAYTEELHRLYLEVVERAENKLEVLPAEFFREVARRFPLDVSLTVIYCGEKVVAFNYSLDVNHSYVFLFCGLDHGLGDVGDAYFNLMYQDLDHAFRARVGAIRLGQASEHFKARLGCDTIPLFFYIKASGLIGALVRAASSSFFPPSKRLRRQHVFKDEEVSRRQEAILLPPP